MSLRPFAKSSRALRFGLIIAGAAALIVGLLAWFQVERERQIDLEDVERRAHVLAYQLEQEVSAALRRSDAEAAPALASRLEGYRRLIGFAVYRADGQLVAAGRGVTEFADLLVGPLQRVREGQSDVSEAARAQGLYVHIFATRVPLGEGDLRGVLAVLHDVSYVDERATGRLIQFAFWVLIVALLVLALVAGVTWLAYERPLNLLAQWMRRLRTENVAEAPPRGLPVALLTSETDRLAASFRAARSAGWSESEAAVRADNVWTRQRLRTHAVHCLKGGQLIVASNREPYMHQYRDGRPRMIIPAGGLVTALDPVLQSCGGLWVAHGAGDADRETADPEGRLTVPPDDARYTLHRVWLTREEEQGYYYGFSNEGLWPLCHLAHERPEFRATDWKYYVEANQRFAATILEEVGDGQAVVLVQDYHLALVPQMLKTKRPDLCVGIFWHIPWPSPEAFRICPWRTEILEGMLGADLVGFHLQQYCNNYLDTVDRMVEARLDWDHFAVDLKGHTALIRPFPISVDSWTERKVPVGTELEEQIQALQAQHGLENSLVALGVDRLDYTKGLPERFRAIARFFEKYPEYRERVTFVQLGAPSRTHIRRYRDLITDLESLADEINWHYRTNGWKPIHVLVAHHSASTVHAFMQMAEVCVVSSLHDGMNLVAKEYVAAKEQGDGVLVLSEFAGAARELPDALIINPYDTEQFAEALRCAVAMDPEERRQRMARMRRQVEEHSIYFWAANFLTTLSSSRPAQAATP